MVDEIASMASLIAKTEGIDCERVPVQNTEGVGVTTVEDSTRESAKSKSELGDDALLLTSEREIANKEIQDSTGYLLPMLFSCCASNIADSKVVLEKLLQRGVPSTMWKLGLQTKVSNVWIGSGNVYDYRVVLLPSIRPPSDCDIELWRGLADTPVSLGSKNLGFCTIPSGTEGLSASEMGRLLVSYLGILECTSGEIGVQTAWF